MRRAGEGVDDRDLIASQTGNGTSHGVANRFDLRHFQHTICGGSNVDDRRSLHVFERSRSARFVVVNDRAVDKTKLHDHVADGLFLAIDLLSSLLGASLKEVERG